MKVFNFIAKLAISLIVLIFLEGLITLGHAFDFTNYHWLAYLAQICFIIICARIALEDWDTWKN